MRSLRGTLVALGAAVSMGGVIATGCGGGSSSNSPPGDGGEGGSGEASADSQADTIELPEAAVDSPATDSSNDQTNPIESGMEASVEAAVEAGVDAPPEAATEASVDASDASALGAQELAFANAVGQSFCQNQLNCCPGGLASGTYSLAACESYAAGYGWEANLPSNYGLFDRGNIQINATQASTCLATISGLPCGTQTPAQWAAVTSACQLVLTGTIPANSGGCIDSFECATDTYCAAPSDGGTGICTPLAGSGGACDTAINSVDNPIPDFMCSYLGSDDTGLYCDLIDPQGSANYGKCQPLLTTNGASCTNGTTFYYDDQACGPASGGALCGDTGCGTTASYPYPGFCTEFTKTD